MFAESATLRGAERVHEARDEDGAAWDDFVDRTAESTHAHRWAWRAILTEVFGVEARYLVARGETGELTGLMPLALMRSRLFGDSLISVPFLSDGGPVGTRQECERLLREARRLAACTGVDRLEIRTRHAVCCDLPPARGKVAVRLPLPERPEILWENTFRTKLRSQIRRPMKEGMEARFGPDHLDGFYAVFSANMRDLGTPVLPRRFFERLLDGFPEEVVFGAVYLRGEPVAGGCGFSWRGEFEMNWASASRRHSAAAPNMLLYWAFMQHAIAGGARVFSFGRSTPGAATHRFKQQWGGVDHPLPWMEWRRGGAHTAANGNGGLVRLATAAWRRLPLAIANRLGPVVARGIPWY